MLPSYERLFSKMGMKLDSAFLILQIRTTDSLAEEELSATEELNEELEAEGTKTLTAFPLRPSTLLDRGISQKVVNEGIQNSVLFIQHLEASQKVAVALTKDRHRVSLKLDPEEIIKVSFKNVI